MALFLKKELSEEIPSIRPSDLASSDSQKVPEKIYEAKDYLASEIELAMANAKITSKNVAVSIPYTSAIISVVTSPLMTEEELKKMFIKTSLVKPCK